MFRIEVVYATPNIVEYSRGNFRSIVFVIGTAREYMGSYKFQRN